MEDATLSVAFLSYDDDDDDDDDDVDDDDKGYDNYVMIMMMI